MSFSGMDPDAQDRRPACTLVSAEVEQDDGMVELKDEGEVAIETQSLATTAEFAAAMVALKSAFRS